MILKTNVLNEIIKTFNMKNRKKYCKIQHGKTYYQVVTLYNSVIIKQNHGVKSSSNFGNTY